MITVKIKVYVIIVTFDAMKWIEKCISSVLESSIQCHPLVIDNNSNDETVEYIKYRFPNVEIIKMQKNLGFGKANNLGLKIALDNDCDYVYLLNQDAWVETDTIEKLIIIQNKNLKYGVISPLQLSGDKSKLDDNFLCCCKECNDLFSDALTHNVNDIYSVDFVMAAHWLISRECLKIVGGFSELFYLYGEDNDYLNRVINKCMLIGIAPKVIGVHDRDDRIESFKKKVYLSFTSSFLCRASNINKPFMSSYIDAFFFLFYSTASLCIKNYSIKPLKNMIKAIVIMPKIIKYRNIASKSITPFLN